MVQKGGRPQADHGIVAGNAGYRGVLKFGRGVVVHTDQRNVLRDSQPRLGAGVRHHAPAKIGAGHDCHWRSQHSQPLIQSFALVSPFFAVLSHAGDFEYLALAAGGLDGFDKGFAAHPAVPQVAGSVIGEARMIALQQMPGSHSRDLFLVNHDGRHFGDIEVSGEVYHRHWQGTGRLSRLLVGDHDEGSVAIAFPQPFQRGIHPLRDADKGPPAPDARIIEKAFENALDEG
jgi:hypothetical protein